MKYVSTEGAPSAIGPYSQAIVSNGFVFTSGQIPIDPQTNEIAGATVAEQTERVIRNLAVVLSAVGSSMDKVVKTTCYLKNMGDFSDFNTIYGKYFASLPARSCVEVSSLPKNVLVEIDVVAEL